MNESGECGVEKLCFCDVLAPCTTVLEMRSCQAQKRDEAGSGSGKYGHWL